VRRSTSAAALGACILTALVAGVSAPPSSPSGAATARTSRPARTAHTSRSTHATRLIAAGHQAVVTYCNGEKARITEPPNPDGGPAPAAVYVHGGSWVSGNYTTGGFLINEIGAVLASKGFVVASLDYALGPKKHWPDQIEDVKCAIRYLRANATQLNINPDEIGAWGQSAGGHLVALLGTAGPKAGWDVGAYPHESSKVEAVVDMAGPSDLEKLGSQGEGPLVFKTFVSILPKIKPHNLGAVLKKASPVTYVAKGDPPFLIVHSDNDRIVFPQQSQELSWDMTANHVSNRLVIVNGAGHEFDQAGAGTTEQDITIMVVEFLTEMLVFHN
jgi:acetyl esterase/lipase